jgi:diamine N-acetyltransferase
MLYFKPTIPTDFPIIIEWEDDPENEYFVFQYSTIEQQEVIDSRDQLDLKLLDNQGVMMSFIISRGLKNPNLSIELKRILIHKKGKSYGKITL